MNIKIRTSEAKIKILDQYVNQLIHQNQTEGRTTLIGLKLYTKSQINRFLEAAKKSLSKGYVTKNQILKLHGYRDIIFKKKENLTTAERIIRYYYNLLTA